MNPVLLTTTSYVTPAATGTASFTISCYGENRYIVVGVSWPYTTTTVQTVKYNGVSLSSKVLSGGATTPSAQLWGLEAPTANTTGTVVISLTAAALFAIGAIAFDNVDQAAPINATISAFGTGSPGSIAMTATVVDTTLVECFSLAASEDPTPATNQEVKWSQVHSTTIRGVGAINLFNSLTAAEGWTTAGAPYARALMLLKPVTSSSNGTHTVQQMLTRSKVDVFRRFSVKRRLDSSTGEYELNWQDISYYVKKWGNIKWTLDEQKYSFFQQAAVSMTLNNDTGFFDHESNPSSFWNGYLTRYKTLCKIDSGFISPTNRGEIPPTNTSSPGSTSTQFVGVLTEPVSLDDSNEAAFNIKSLSSVLEDVPANLLLVASAGASGQLTGSDLIYRMRNMTDGSSNYILRKFIASESWTIAATSQTLTALNTTTAIDSYSCWGLAKKLAEMSNKAVWISKLGVFNFGSKEPTSNTQFVFSGIPFNNTTYGHTIKEVTQYQEDLDNLYNRIKVKFGEDNTSTSYILKNQAISVGDSTTAWKYGARLLEFENTWLDSTNAEIIASTLYVDLNTLKEKVGLKCKYIPTLQLLDRTSIQYDKQAGTASLWDISRWDVDVWTPARGPVYYFTGKEYKILAIDHDLEAFETDITLRRI